MGESDDEGDNYGIDLSGFLFGNIDDHGRLEDDSVLDSESQRALCHLGRLGFNTLDGLVEDREIRPDYDDDSGDSDKGYYMY